MSHGSWYPLAPCGPLHSRSSLSSFTCPQSKHQWRSLQLFNHPGLLALIPFEDPESLIRLSPHSPKSLSLPPSALPQLRLGAQHMRSKQRTEEHKATKEQRTETTPQTTGQVLFSVIHSSVSYTLCETFRDRDTPPKTQLIAWQLPQSVRICKGC